MTRGWDFSELFCLFFQSFPPFFSLLMCHYAIIFRGVTFTRLGKVQTRCNAHVSLRRQRVSFPLFSSWCHWFLSFSNSHDLGECPWASNCVCPYSLIWCVRTPGSWTSSSGVWRWNFIGSMSTGYMADRWVVCRQGWNELFLLVAFWCCWTTFTNQKKNKCNRNLIEKVCVSLKREMSCGF